MTPRQKLVLSSGALWVGMFGVLRLSLLAPEDCPPVSDDDAYAAAEGAADWIAGTQTSDGRFLYEYDRGSDEVLPGYNIVRHAGVTMSLYQVADAGDDGSLAPADAGLEMMLDRLVPAGDGQALVDRGSGEARLGATALMAAALAARRDATGDDRYDRELRDLGRFMEGQIQPSGRTLALYDLNADQPVDEVSRYATGEAGWALARLHTLFPGEGWDAPARQILHYLATDREEVEGMDYAPWPDQWAAYLLAELAPSGLGEEEVTYARALAQRFGMLMRSESQKDGYPLPSFVDPTARGAGLGVWVEGLGSLSRVAAVDDRLADLREPLGERLECGASLLAERQVGPTDAEEYVDPERVAGAWFRDDLTRMDDQQHALSGLLAAAGRQSRDR